MRVLGISVWIHFIWIFVVGVLLFFFTVHPGLEGFQTGGSGSGSRSGSGSGSNRGNTASQVWIQRYSSGEGLDALQGSAGWYPLKISSDRILYQDKLPVGGKLFSSNAKYMLHFNVGGLIEIRSATTGSNNVIYSFQTSATASYIMHQGDIRVVNSDGSFASSPFDISQSIANGGSLEWYEGSNSGSGSRNSNIDKTICILQLQNDGDLVFKTIDGIVLYHTDTAVPVVIDPCAEINEQGATAFAYPFRRSDCFSIKNSLIRKRADLASYTAAQKIVEMKGAQNTICVLNRYYTSLACDNYVSTHSDPSLAPPPVPLPKPVTTATASLTSGSDTISISGTSLVPYITIGDMIYLGYGTDIQGPFIVSGISDSSITITKKYVGANISAAPVSMTPALRSNLLNACGTATEGGSALNLTAGGGQVFTGVKYAYYGNPTGDCTSGHLPGSVNSLYEKIIKYITETCIGKTSCTLNVTNVNMGGDPATGTTKSLAASLFYNDLNPSLVDRSRLCGVANDFGTITITSRSGPFSSLDYAYYRSTVSGNCTTGFSAGYVTTGPSAVSYQARLENYIKEQCIGKVSCTITVSPSAIGIPDPEPGTSKRLAMRLSTNMNGLVASSQPVKMSLSGVDAKVSIFPGNSYVVITNSDPILNSSSTLCGVADDGGTITITSTTGPFSSLDYAYYRSTVSGNCSAGFSAGYATTGSSAVSYQARLEDYIKQQCLGQVTCSISVLPSTFGITDPQPGITKKLAIRLSTTTNTVPENLDIGDLVFINGTCNTYDTDNGDGTCTAYLCNMGENDLLNNTCQTYQCNNTVVDILGSIPDVNNGDGTCTTPIKYVPCNTGETTNYADNTCNNPTGSHPYKYVRTKYADSYTYAVSKMGIKSSIYTKTQTNYKYIYNKNFGPYVVSVTPSSNKIMIKTIGLGMLDISGRFILNTDNKNYTLAYNKTNSLSDTRFQALSYNINFIQLDPKLCAARYNVVLWPRTYEQTSQYGNKYNAYTLDEGVKVYNLQQSVSNSVLQNSIASIDLTPNGVVESLIIGRDYDLSISLSAFYFKSNTWGWLGDSRDTDISIMNGIDQSSKRRVSLGTLDDTLNTVSGVAYGKMPHDAMPIGTVPNAGNINTYKITLPAARSKVITLFIEYRSTIALYISNITLSTKVNPTPVNLFTYNSNPTASGLPSQGIINAKLYKPAYADGSFNGSYTSLIAGDSCTNRQLTVRQSVTFDLTGTSPSVRINSLNLVPGLKYTLVIYVKSNSSVQRPISLEYAPSKYYSKHNDPTNSESIYYSGSLTNNFTSIMWTFIAVAPNLCFRISNAGATPLTIEFNALTIQGGMDGPVLPLACAGGVTTNGILNVCKGGTSAGSGSAAASAAADVAAGVARETSLNTQLQEAIAARQRAIAEADYAAAAGSYVAAAAAGVAPSGLSATQTASLTTADVAGILAAQAAAAAASAVGDLAALNAAGARQRAILDQNRFA